ncbi:MAG: DMT family transporter [Acetobacteraceae bacterium]
MRLRPATRLDGLAVGVMPLLCLCWGVQQVASKVALGEGMPPLLQALIRSVVASPLLLVWLALRRGRAGLAELWARDGTLGPGLASAVLFALEFIFLFPGVQRTSASHAVVLLFSGGLFTAVGGHFLIPGERLRPVHVAGLLLAFVGVAATIGGGSGSAGSSLTGDVLCLAAAAAWGFTTVLIKANPRLAAAPAEKVLLYQLAGSAPILLVATGLASEFHWPDASALAWASLLYQSVVVAFASYLAWFWLVGRYPAGRLAAFSFLTPLMGVLAASLLLGDPLTPLLLVGLVCVAGGLRLVNWG